MPPGYIFQGKMLPKTVAFRIEAHIFLLKCLCPSFWCLASRNVPLQAGKKQSLCCRQTDRQLKTYKLGIASFVACDDLIYSARLWYTCIYVGAKSLPVQCEHPKNLKQGTVCGCMWRRGDLRIEAFWTGKTSVVASTGNKSRKSLCLCNWNFLLFVSHWNFRICTQFQEQQTHFLSWQTIVFACLCFTTWICLCEQLHSEQIKRRNVAVFVYRHFFCTIAMQWKFELHTQGNEAAHCQPLKSFDTFPPKLQKLKAS